jgi:large conductance mechanosensitive channel
MLVAGAIFLVIKAINTAKAKFDVAKVEEKPAAPPEDVVLLREIRDALVKR